MEQIVDASLDGTLVTPAWKTWLPVSLKLWSMQQNNWMQ